MTSPASPAEPAAPPPDDKDWTWVLERACPDCGFDPASIAAADVAARTRAATAPWSAQLVRADVRDRPQPQVWSVLEYAAHVRDVCRLFAARLALMLDEDDPVFPNWDQDETALAERYHEQDPTAVARELDEAAAAVAAAFAAVDGDQWGRTGRRSDGARFTVETFGRYFLHDLEHHLADVGVPVQPKSG